MRNDFESNYLAHHGILGQKWGVRRYQNPDGSLTEAGRKRYGVSEGKGVSDISSERGIKRRTKDLKKAIKINEKKRGKEHSKIENNLLLNAFGVNKRRANKISDYSENIKKGKEELDKLNKLQENFKSTKKDQKQLSKDVVDSVKKNGWNGNDEAREKIKNAVSKEQQDTLRKKYKEWQKAFNAEEGFYESKEYQKAHNDAYNDTFNWYKKNDPDQLNYWIKKNNGRTSGLDDFHDFRKLYEGYDDEYTSKAHDNWNKSHNIDSAKEKQLWADFNDYAKDVTESLVGKYGNTKLDVSLNTGKKFNVDDYVKGSVMTSAMMENGFKKKK